MRPTPTQDRSLPRRFADFETLVDAVEYAACGERGINFYSARGELTDALPYSEIRNRAVEIGRRLVSLGLNRGDRVALRDPTSPLDAGEGQGTGTGTGAPAGPLG